MDPQVTIQQIGRMTLGAVGARQFQHSGDSLSFKISRGHRMVNITLEPDDTYYVRTYMIRSGRVVFQQRSVYCDQLSEAVWDAHLEPRLNTHLGSDPRYPKHGP